MMVNLLFNLNLLNPVLAAQESEKVNVIGFDFWNILFTIINLVVLYLLMKKFLFKPVMEIMEKRENMIKEQLQRAQESESSANELKAQWEEKIKTADDESERIIQQSREKAKNEYVRIVDDADKEATKIIVEARKNIETEKENTLNSVQSEIADLAMTAARKIVEESKNAKADNNIYNDFLAKAGDVNDPDFN